MRFAALTLALAACSSPPAKPSMPPAQVVPDAVPASVVIAPVLPAPTPDATVAAGPPCLPRKAEPWFGADGVIVACDFRARDCYHVSPDGAVTSVPEPPEPRHAQILGALVEICPGGGAACATLSPTLADGEVPRMADVDLALTTATVVIRADGASSARVELWDVNADQRVAAATIEDGLYAWLLGKTILIATGTTDETRYALWKRDKTKLKRIKALDREPEGWIVLDDTTAVVRWQGTVDVVDTTTGKISHPVQWQALASDPGQAERIFFGELGDGTYAVAPMDADRRMLGIGIGDAKGNVTPYAVTFCP